MFVCPPPNCLHQNRITFAAVQRARSAAIDRGTGATRRSCLVFAQFKGR
ncbi:hypothetical protein MMMB2_4421 [Mycobacterium marinum MB2]|nr:hypothetical protein MMSP_5024 [Mycobacterium sp. 012931]EPQ73649.1 hypothetical protein MMMB2_4421 [Mycobacterium marinum MB2]